MTVDKTHWPRLIKGQRNIRTQDKSSFNRNEKIKSISTWEFLNVSLKVSRLYRMTIFFFSFLSFFFFFFFFNRKIQTSSKSDIRKLFEIDRKECTVVDQRKKKEKKKKNNFVNVKKRFFSRKLIPSFELRRYSTDSDYMFASL